MATQTTHRTCGRVVAEATDDRSWKWACSEAHADDHVVKVRAEKQRQIGTTDAAPFKPQREGHWGGG